MATFTDIKGNLGVKLIITETAQDISNNTTTISYSARVYKTGNHNPFNNYTQTPFKLVINGEVIYNQNANYDLRDWTADYRLSRTEQVITSGTRTIKHNDNGSKSISASWSGDFTSTGTIYGYGSVLASGDMNLTDIPRVSKASLSKVNFNLGELVTLTTNRRSANFTHSASYVVGGVETLLATDIGVSKNISIPVSRANSIPNSSSESMNIRVKTFNGTIEVGSHDIPVTVNVPSTVIPKVDGVSLSETVSNANIFSNNNSNYIRGISKVKATAINARGEYGSTINQYEFRLKDDTSYNGVSKSNNFTFGVLNIPAQGSKLYKFQCRVQDSRGRYSNWVDSSDVRFHYYTTPTINMPTLSRDGTVLSVERTYSVQSIMENGVERNVGNLSFQTRPKGSSSWTSNGGAKHTGISLNKSSDTLLGVFLENVAYEVQGILSDKLSTVYSGIAVSGAAFVTLEVLLGTGIGVGRSPIAGNGNLQIGSGGASIDGGIQISGAGGNVSPVAALYNPSGGLLIDIMHSETSQMITVEIIGNSYNVNTPINSTFQTYHYNPVGTFLNTSQLNNGFNIPQGRFFIHNSRIKLWFPVNDSFQTYIVRAYGMNGRVLNPTINGTTMPTSGITGDISYCAVRQVSQINENNVKTLINNSLSGYALKSDIPSQTPYSGGNSTTDGYYIIGNYQVAYGTTTVGAISGLTSTRGGNRNFYRAFSETPFVQVSMNAQGEYLSGMAYVHSVTKTGFTAAIYDSNGFGSTEAQNRTINYLAIGRK